MHYPAHLLKLIETLKHLSGVGSRSAERFAFEMLNWPVEQLELMGQVIAELKRRVLNCVSCGCLMQDAHCRFCEDKARNQNLICVIASPRDAFALEKTQEYRGLYHVLGGLLSPLDGRGQETLNLSKFFERVREGQIQEVVLALDSTLEGDITALYVKQELASYSLKVSRIAFGLPMGSSLDFVDGDTLARAFSGRRQF